MIKIAILILSLFLTQNLYATCDKPGECNFTAVLNYYYKPGAVYTSWVISGAFFGPDQRDEYDAMSTSSNNSGGTNGCPGCTTSPTWCFDYSTGTSPNKVAHVCTWCPCEPPVPEYDYCITKGWSCANGAAVCLEYTLCVEGFPTGGSLRCGNSATAQAIESGEIDGNVYENPNCACNMSEEDIENICNQIDAKAAKCDDCSQSDSDSDGVNDCDDNCPDSPSGSQVSAQGCPLTDGDGDGVPDNQDMCPGTAKGATVDALGCPLDTDGDKDNDGIPDSEDSCPETAGTGANGCPIDNPQPDPDPDGGDQDNDNPLLEGIIGWLKRIWAKDQEIETELNKANNSLDSMETKSQEQIDEQKKLNETAENIENALTNIENALTDTGQLEQNETPIDDQAGYDKMENILDDQQSFWHNSPIGQFFSNVGIQASGDCNFHFINPINGSQINCSLCPYEEYFTLLGTLLLGLTTIFTGLYIFKG